MTEDKMLFHRVARQVTERLRSRSAGNTVLITSARPREGKTFFAYALASTLRQQGVPSVAVVDCAGTEQSARGRGGSTLNDLLSGSPLQADFGPIDGDDQPTFIAYGSGDPALLFRREAVTRAIAQLSSRFAFVILDGPVLANCGVLSSCADGNLLIIDAERTRREIVKGTLKAYPIEPQKMLGAVLNRKPYYVPPWLYRRAF